VVGEEAYDDYVTAFGRSLGPLASVAQSSCGAFSEYRSHGDPEPHQPVPATRALESFEKVLHHAAQKELQWLHGTDLADERDRFAKSERAATSMFGVGLPLGPMGPT